MKTSSAKMAHALTLIETLVVIAIIAILLAMFLPTPRHGEIRAKRLACVNNLRQVGVAFHSWAKSHNEQLPMQVSTSDGGTKEFINESNVFIHYRIMSNELVTPKILFCPAEADSTRWVADAFSKLVSDKNKWQVSFTGRTKVSYFVGVDSVITNGEMFLSGDHNITNSDSLKNHMMELTTNSLPSWTDEIHFKQGNIVLTDGSVQQFSTATLRYALEQTGVATNRLAVP